MELAKMSRVDRFISEHTINREVPCWRARAPWVLVRKLVQNGGRRCCRVCPKDKPLCLLLCPLIPVTNGSELALLVYIPDVFKVLIVICLVL
jgi:hypothetical protein